MKSFSLRETYEIILSLADALLKDDCPISEVDSWAFIIDDRLIQLKFWGKQIGIDHGILDSITRDVELASVTRQLFMDIDDPLSELISLANDLVPEEDVRYADQSYRIDEALQRFETASDRLTSTADIYQSIQMQWRNESFLQKRELQMFRQGEQLNSTNEALQHQSAQRDPEDEKKGKESISRYASAAQRDFESQERGKASKDASLPLQIPWAKLDDWYHLDQELQDNPFSHEKILAKRRLDEEKEGSSLQDESDKTRK
ncbi:hypothetical protein ACLMJK_008760 [Lecanora helva]